MAKRTLPKIEESALPFQCYATYHPSLVIEGQYHYEQKIEADFSRLSQSVLEPPSAATPRGRAIGFDTEYDSGGALLTVGVADGERAVAYETTGRSWKQDLSKVLKHANVIVGHSVPGDLDYLVRLGLAKDTWLRGLDLADSLLLARMYDENKGKGAYGLETLMLGVFNTDPWKAETEKLIKATGNAADWTPEQRIARCRLDAWATRMLAKYFKEKLDAAD